MEIEAISKAVIPILKKHEIKRAGLFGSTARGAMNDESDVDILVEVGKEISLLDFVGIRLELEDALGRAVDLV